MAESRRRLRPIEVLPLGDVPGDLLEWLGSALSHSFGVSVSVAPRAPIADAARMADARFDANALLDQLIAGRAGNGVVTLGVIDADIAAAGLDFVFGEATVGGCCAVVALARLRPAAADDLERLCIRAVTESAHEIGHVLGLRHCADPACVMFLSHDVMDTDRKGSAFCASCAAALARA
jgi:archaemetzincin